MAGKKVTPEAAGKLLGDALADAAFRQKLLNDPKKTLQDHGFEASTNAVHFFQSLNTKAFGEAAHKVKTKAKHDPLDLGEAEAHA